MRLVNRRDGRVIAETAEFARSLSARLIGLIGRRELAPGSALVIPGCRQIHTFLMRFPIDVIFTNEQDRVVHIVERLGPCKAAGCRAASQAIELPAGTISACGIRPGDHLTSIADFTEN
jgi:hypothetical protein